MTYTGYTDTHRWTLRPGSQGLGWEERWPCQTRRDTERMRLTFSEGVHVLQELAHHQAPGLLVGHRCPLTWLQDLSRLLKAAKSNSRASKRHRKDGQRASACPAPAFRSGHAGGRSGRTHGLSAPYSSGPAWCLSPHARHCAVSALPDPTSHCVWGPVFSRRA